MKNRQLFTLMPTSFLLPHHVGFDGKVVAKEAESLPFMYWPDGVPCVEANAYMLSLCDRGLSRRTRGGTIRQYALNITPLIRFCHQNRHCLTELTDNLFTLFVKGLQAKNTLGQQQRSANEVIKIGRQSISFLRFIATFSNHPSLIGAAECAIIVEERSYNIVAKSKRSINVTTWYHSSFPSPDPVSKRHPISNEVVLKLKQQARKIPDRGLRKRKELTIACLEQTGGRRTEVANILVSDIESADFTHDSAPLLRMITIKRRMGSIKFRYVPVPRTFIEQAMDYIRYTRRKVIRKTIGKSNDHDYLLINHTSGKKLSDNTITNELNELCQSAKITEQAHPHLFRHAFITQKLKAIILHHDISNQDEFRKALLNTEAFKLKLQEWTGHTQLSSLDTYIDLAFNELCSMDKVYSAVQLSSSVGLAMDRINSLRVDAQLKSITPTQLFIEIESMLETLQVDISKAEQNHVERLD